MTGKVKLDHVFSLQAQTELFNLSLNSFGLTQLCLRDTAWDTLGSFLPICKLLETKKGKEKTT